MNELRLVRREEQSLVVAAENGDEFRLVVDETVLGELRALSRRTSTSDVPVRPREIQALIREGKTRDEVVEITGISEDDIERYEEPVIAERRYVLERAQAVPVRTGTGEEGSEQFGAVIGERLATLGAEEVSWDSWRDTEAGWMISLTFRSHGVEYRAVWSFEHRKAVLAPVTTDAVNLSKQGDVSDRLIPKLRAVDAPAGTQQFETHAFEAHDADLADDTADLSRQGVGSGTDHPSTHAAESELDDDEEFARRREIEQRAISTTQDEGNDLGQTADLLDALRRRRGEREATLQPSTEQPGLVTPGESDTDAASTDATDAHPTSSHPRETPATGGTPSSRGPQSDAPLTLDVPMESPSTRGMADTDRSESDQSSGPDAERSSAGLDRGGRSKRRASIPSWDDILFGTRSDEDPVT